MTNSNLASAEEKLEWLLNCVSPGMSERYDTLRAESVIELGVQSTLLVKSRVDMNVRNDKSKSKLIRFFFCVAQGVISVIQKHRMISKQVLSL